MSNLIVFDLDGVITSEEAYWDAAGLMLHELLYSPRYWNLDESQLGADGLYHPAATAEESRRISRSVFPESEILALKARSINSNWDTGYAATCLRLIDLLASLPTSSLSALLPLWPWDASWLANFRRQIASQKGMGNEGDRSQGDPRGRPYHDTIVSPLGPHEISFFDSPFFQGHVGLELINRFDAYASQLLGVPFEDVFSRHSPFWTFCQDIFQEWYLGDELYTETYGHPPAQRGKPGCVNFERPLLPVEQLRNTLETLRQQGYVLGFATGRTYREAAHPLKMYGLLKYFDEQHISPYDYVEQAEAELRASGDQTLLGKPHPFQFLAAVDHKNVEAAHPGDDEGAPSRVWGTMKAVSTLPGGTIHDNFIVVGDSTSDILGGRAAGAITVAVLTGARTAEARSLLAQSGPDFTIDDMTKLPALLEQLDSLATIQRLQFTGREKAERLLLRWFARHMNLQTESVTLTPKAVSLNSFNGFYRAGGKEYFFKTHVEEQGVLQEYYHAELLAKAGYNIVRPLRTLHEEGRQMVIYPVVHWPVMFDLIWAVETGRVGDMTMESLVQAERQECEHLLDIYKSTLAPSTAEEHAHAPIHQLFWHRLAGERLKSFYAGKRVLDPHTTESSISFDQILTYRWVINGVVQPHALGELIERAKVVLNPSRAAMTIIGHGDAHFGNVFLENQKTYLYFDPAFAGRHSPLLEVVKPLFHNIFATWMYFPYDIARDLQLSVTISDETLFVEHDYTLTPLRQAILQTKVEYLLTPLISWLRSGDALPADWLEIMQLALMCCPLLTINLFDEERMPSTIGWLGLSLAVQMGNGGIKSWRNDR